jgi:translation elongation factor EF-G
LLRSSVQGRSSPISSVVSPSVYLDSGAQLVNATSGKKERIGKIFQMHANKERTRLTASPPVHIYAAIGLKRLRHG